MLTHNHLELIGYLNEEPVFERKRDNFCITQFHLRVEPELKAPKEGTESRRAPQVELIPIKVFNKCAEAIMKYCRVGDALFIVGKLSCFHGTSKITGKPYEIMQVEAMRVQFLTQHGSTAQGGNILGRENRESNRTMGPGDAPSAADFRSAPDQTAVDVDQVLEDAPF